MYWQAILLDCSFLFISFLLQFKNSLLVCLLLFDQFLFILKLKLQAFYGLAFFIHFIPQSFNVIFHIFKLFFYLLLLLFQILDNLLIVALRQLHFLQIMFERFGWLAFPIDFDHHFLLLFNQSFLFVFKQYHYFFLFGLPLVEQQILLHHYLV